MTIEQRDVVDFLSLDKLGNAVLTVSDHLPWDDVNEHLFCLQEKINAYLRFIESREIYEKYPEAREHPIIISVRLKFAAPRGADWFFEKTTAAIQNAGLNFEVRHISN